MTVLISHIPKTAGTSLRTLVGRRDPETVFVYSGELMLGNPDIDFITRFRAGAPPPVVMGHFSYGAHRLLGIAPAYATVLREPIARVVSLYRHLRSLPHSEFSAFFEAGISLEEFVAREITDMTNNHMCRMIAGIAPEAGLVINERWLLDLALHNLERHYLLAGTQQNLPAFVAALAALLGWETPEIPRENQSTGAAVELDERTRAVIVYKNQLDMRLFEHVGKQRDGLLERFQDAADPV